MNEIRVCPKCGNEIIVDSTITFCPNCGQKISKSTANNSMIAAYKEMFKNYANFKGRSRRRDYWYASLANFLIFMIAYAFFAPAILDMQNTGEPTTLSAMLMGVSSVAIVIYSIAIIIPGLALTVRRLHDTGKSGWFLFLGLIPYIGGIVLFVFMVSNSQTGENKYGPNPKDELIHI